MRLVLLWVNNHFNDFESSAEMMELLEGLEGAMGRWGLRNHRTLLNIACSVKARPRSLALPRPSNDPALHFSLLGCAEKGRGIFVRSVEAGSKAQSVGLKRGDQILEANGRDFHQISLRKAVEVLTRAPHLSLTVKSNLLAFRETQESGNCRRKAETLLRPASRPLIGSEVEVGGTLGKMFQKLKQGASFGEAEDALEVSLHPDPLRCGRSLQRMGGLLSSRSNPDVSQCWGRGEEGDLSQFYSPSRLPSTPQVIKLHRSDQSFKFLTIYEVQKSF